MTPQQQLLGIICDIILVILMARISDEFKEQGESDE